MEAVFESGADGSDVLGLNHTALAPEPDYRECKCHRAPPCDVLAHRHTVKPHKICH